MALGSDCPSQTVQTRRVGGRFCVSREPFWRPEFDGSKYPSSSADARRSNEGGARIWSFAQDTRIPQGSWVIFRKVSQLCVAEHAAAVKERVSRRDLMGDARRKLNSLLLRSLTFVLFLTSCSVPLS